MRTALRPAVPALLVPLLVASCGGGSSGPSSPSQPPTLSSVTVSGATSLNTIGQTAQLTATAAFSDGSTQAVSGQVTWESSDPSVVSVSASGLCTAVTFGKADIRARYQGVTGTLSVAVFVNVGGTWRGTWQSYWLSGPLSATLTQTGTAVAGTFTVGESFCFIAPVDATGTVSGGSVTLKGSAGDGSQTTLTGTLDAAGSVWTGTTDVTSGARCAAAAGTFRLVRQ